MERKLERRNEKIHQSEAYDSPCEVGKYPGISSDQKSHRQNDEDAKSQNDICLYQIFRYKRGHMEKFHRFSLSFLICPLSVIFSVICVLSGILIYNLPYFIFLFVADGKIAEKCR